MVECRLAVLGWRRLELNRVKKSRVQQELGHVECNVVKSGVVLCEVYYTV